LFLPPVCFFHTTLPVSRLVSIGLRPVCLGSRRNVGHDGADATDDWLSPPYPDSAGTVSRINSKNRRNVELDIRIGIISRWRLCTGS
jgi:hypothetical protein